MKHRYTRRYALAFTKEAKYSSIVLWAEARLVIVYPIT